MYISKLFNGGSPVFSFEFFPPKTAGGDESLRRTISELCPLAPGFVSVTYGAGGSTRDRTLELVSYIKNDVGLETMAHLTCVGAGRADIGRTLDRLVAAGIENVIALRGDPPAGESSFVATVDGLAHASDLVRLIREREMRLCLAVAGYPEGHPEAPSLEQDLAYLAEKVAAGASLVITQLFFDNATYFVFVDKARRAGVSVPIVPGIMPITDLGQIERFTKMCGAGIPRSLRDRLEPVRDDAEAVAAIGVDHATRQCRELLAKGAPGIHFYTLNRSRSTRNIVSELKGEEL